MCKSRHSVQNIWPTTVNSVQSESTKSPISGRNIKQSSGKNANVTILSLVPKYSFLLSGNHIIDGIVQLKTYDDLLKLLYLRKHIFQFQNKIYNGSFDNLGGYAPN